MNVVIFVTYRKRRPQYLAVCQCGARHGPYAKVALIPPQCLGCERKAPTASPARGGARPQEENSSRDEFSVPQG
jgi:hypothetical protein